MSHSSPSYYPPADPAFRHTRAHTQSAGVMSRHLHRSHDGYILTHAGHQVRIGPVAFWIVVGTLVIMAVWSIATGTYFAFRDNVLTRLIGRQTEMQFAYEDRISELRAQIDRIMSRQLLDQEQFEQKLNALLQRQTTLEQRNSALTGDLATGSIKPSRIAPPTATLPEKTPRLSPISDTVIFVAPSDREARLHSRELPASSTRIAERTTAGGLNGVLARVSLSLDKVEQRQADTLTDLEERVDTRVRRIRSVLADLGVDSNASAAAAGGPFVPVKPPQSGASAFERQLYRINVARTQISRYGQTLVAVPVRKPIIGEVDMSSPFGMRMDPFLGRPAIHTGIDLRGDVGEPVRATATGHVSIAGREGGYGNIVEINHGNGLATRYGHLSSIDVKIGQLVRIGEVVGRIGSTGRSTGPHLHYETRVNGEAVDPQKFLRAGLRLGEV
jgi:murein DD-endopeptidase MepM/ murein hydrolase activator NlpD